MCNHPFFIVGCERSGTTMLRLMLNEHGNLFVGTETVFILDLLPKFPLDRPLSRAEQESVAQTIVQHERWPDFGLDADLATREMLAQEGLTLGEVVSVFFRSYAASHGRPRARWGDKTPFYLGSVAALAHMFPDARFIHIVRDARDVCISLRNVKGHPDDFVACAHIWRKSLRQGLASIANLADPSRVLTVRYEDVVRSPERELRRICEFLGEEYSPSMLDFHHHATNNTIAREEGMHVKTRRPPDPHKDIGRWQRELKWYQVALIEAIVRREMDQVGQRRHYRSLLLPVLWLASLLMWSAERTQALRLRLGIRLPDWRKLF